MVENMRRTTATTLTSIKRPLQMIPGCSNARKERSTHQALVRNRKRISQPPDPVKWQSRPHLVQHQPLVRIASESATFNITSKSVIRGRLKGSSSSSIARGDSGRPVSGVQNTGVCLKPLITYRITGEEKRGVQQNRTHAHRQMWCQCGEIDQQLLEQSVRWRRFVGPSGGPEHCE